ncbi:uncharacterized protein KY384_006090 [Bacidia gigantensis]|uniref:uncharacterized protein n=1 Tax=Bacidia gigantensis TaxID=2732470 RepID=UPI001D051683|nr:uncharacterized protein KY384_006090 [Bacidia gigantensis]KAG8529453.1 hypothetical protein KY384_006090 [Bacidia gigantensis]
MVGQRHSSPPESTGTEGFILSDYPRPRFYIVRPDKTFVPLIAVDEINPMLRLHGVPRALAIDEIDKWNLARVGDLVDRPGQYYSIDLGGSGEGSMDTGFSHVTRTISNQSPPQQTNDPPKTSTDSPSRSSINSNSSFYTSQSDLTSHVNQGPGPSPIHNGREENHENVHATDQARLDNQVSKMDVSGFSIVTDEKQNTLNQYVHESQGTQINHPSKTKDAATPGYFGKKKFCTYWIRTGNCDYIQEGCKYLHVIPDEETRLRIGIRDMPRWAKEDFPQQQEPVHPKHSLALTQDWRRPHPGQPAKYPKAEKPRHPDTLSTTRSTQQVNRTENSHNTSIKRDQQSLPNNGHNLARTNGFNSQSPFDPTSAGAPGTSIHALKAVPFQAEMQSAPLTSHPPPPVPSSSAAHYPPPTQPPISRPTNDVYQAPDKVSPSKPAPSDDLRSLLEGSEPVTVMPTANGGITGTSSQTNNGKLNGLVSQAVNKVSPKQALATASHTFCNHGPVKPPGQQGTNVMDNLFHLSTPSSQVPSAFQNHQAINGSSGSLPSFVANQTNGALSAQSQDIRLDSNHAETETPSNNGHSEIYWHRRHFAGPGQSQFVASRVEEEKPREKKNGHGGQRKRSPRGKSSKGDLSGGK